MVEISKSGSGEGRGWATGPGYSTLYICPHHFGRHGFHRDPSHGALPALRGQKDRRPQKTPFAPHAVIPTE